jgi:hypothetical protein
MPEPETCGPTPPNTAVRIRTADEATLSSLWADIVAPRTAFLAACQWTIPSHPSRAWSWATDQATELLLVTEGPSGPGVVFARKELPVAMVGQLVILLPERATVSECCALAGPAVDFAFRRGLNKCEWTVDSSRRAELDAAARLGFLAEVTYPDVYLTDSGRGSGVLMGMLRAEWERRSTDI